jgi:hypothetical protein
MVLCIMDSKLVRISVNFIKSGTYLSFIIERGCTNISTLLRFIFELKVCKSWFEFWVPNSGSWFQNHRKKFEFTSLEFHQI